MKFKDIATIKLLSNNKTYLIDDDSDNYNNKNENNNSNNEFIHMVEYYPHNKADKELLKILLRIIWNNI